MTEYQYGRARATDSVTGEELIGFKIPKLGGRIPSEALASMQRPQAGIQLDRFRKKIKPALKNQKNVN
jgi:hypothetical protein